MMRGGGGRRHSDEEEESVFISMTDMTVSFLFIVIILLIFFASQFSPDAAVVPQSDFDALKLRAERLVEVNEDLRNTNASLLERNTEQAKKILQSAKEIAVLESAKAELEAALHRDRARIGDLETQLAEMKSAIGTLSSWVAELEAEISALKRMSAQKAEALLVAQARIEELEAKLATMTRPNELEEYFAAADTARTDLLNHIRDQIVARFPELRDIISVENGALRFQSDQGLFDKGDRTIRADRRALVASIAATLDEVLPCYTTGPRSRWSATCNPGFAMIEAVQIEGHTDSDGADGYNADLAAARALDTYLRMVGGGAGAGERMLEHRNIDGQPVLSLAAYGENRPIRPNDGTENKSANRRIDLRFIMVAPQRVEGIGRIRAALREGLARP
jgi:outer membrane protein OmpA-like peptidoglycan-associated protein